MPFLRGRVCDTGTHLMWPKGHVTVRTAWLKWTSETQGANFRGFRRISKRYPNLDPGPFTPGSVHTATVIRNRFKNLESPAFLPTFTPLLKILSPLNAAGYSRGGRNPSETVSPSPEGLSNRAGARKVPERVKYSRQCGQGSG